VEWYFVLIFFELATRTEAKETEARLLILKNKTEKAGSVLGPTDRVHIRAHFYTGHLRFFYFYIFYFRFLQKYIFDMEIYRNIPGRPAAGRPGPGRPAAGRQGLIRKKNTKNNCRQVPGTGRQAVGRPAPLAGRQLGGRLSLPI